MENRGSNTRVAEALLVEDHQRWQRILGDELLRAGYRYDWAGNLDEALRKIAEPLIAYNLVVLDPHLDSSLGSLSGQLVADAIRSSKLEPSVILVSGYLSAEELRKVFAAHADRVKGYFEKGLFNIVGFRELLQRLSGVKGQAEALYRPNIGALQEAYRAVCNAQTSASKGRSLEVLSEALLTSIPLLECKDRNRRIPTAELDRVFRVQKLPGTVFQDWGQILIVECKHWQRKIDAKTIRTFAALLENCRSHVGILFSKSGITGKADTDARGQIRNTYMSSGVIILVFNDADLKAVIDKGENLYEMLESKDRNVRLLG